MEIPDEAPDQTLDWAGRIAVRLPVGLSGRALHGYRGGLSTAPAHWPEVPDLFGRRRGSDFALKDSPSRGGIAK